MRLRECACVFFLSVVLVHHLTLTLACRLAHSLSLSCRDRVRFARDAVAANATRALLAAGGDDALARDAAGATPLLYAVIATARALLAGAVARVAARTPARDALLDSCGVGFLRSNAGVLIKELGRPTPHEQQTNFLINGWQIS